MKNRFLTDIDDRIVLSLVGGLAMLAGLIGGAVSGRVLNVEKRIEVTQIERVAKKIIRVEAVQYVPGAEVVAKPLKDPKQACTGAPVRIIRLHTQTNEKTQDQSTFVTVQPIGDGYTVVCFKSGFYANLWAVGDVVSITDGAAS